MSNSKENEVVSDNALTDGADIKTLQAKIKELEAKVAGGEEAALKRVCKALGEDPEDFKAAESSIQDEPTVRCHVPTLVVINGNRYLGTVEVKKSTFDVIQQAIGDRFMRRMRELTGNDYIVDELSQGAFTPRVVGKVDINGEKIA